MRSLYSFIIKPKYQRNNNTKKVDDIDLILNTDMQNHEFVSRIGIVLETPINEKTGIKKGDEVIVHHNVYRRFYDIRGDEQNSKSYFKEDQFFVYTDQIFMYKRKDQWQPLDGYCFVKPLVNKDKFSTSKEQELLGVIKYLDNTLIKNGIKKNDLVGFTPNSEYEFIVDGQRLYMVMNKFITVKYEYQGNEEEYNPSWSQSC